MMRNIAICSNEVENLILGQDSVKTIDMNGILVRCGLLRTENIYFDRNAVSNRFKVLVKKKAFSCNYRDKSIIFRITKQAPENTFYVVGSDFVGEVIATGSEVTELKVGDRVIANNAYPESDALEAFPGIPSNHASKEY